MKFFAVIVIIIVLGFAGCLILPWWSIALVGFITILLIPLTPLRSFSAGFIAIFILWFLSSLWISSNNNHILAQKVSLIILKMNSPFLLIFITAIIGGLIAGLGALSGSFLWTAFQKNKVE
ncbi:MAG: hypothetical protein ABIR81_05925 [Ginsengibacter sp.]